MFPLGHRRSYPPRFPGTPVYNNFYQVGVSKLGTVNRAALFDSGGGRDGGGGGSDGGSGSLHRRNTRSNPLTVVVADDAAGASAASASGCCFSAPSPLVPNESTSCGLYVAFLGLR